MGPRNKTLELLYANTILNDRTGCLEWQGSIRDGKYGGVFHDGQKLYAHRLAYMLAYNVELAPDDYVCHKCDNRLCINVDHLFLGDAKANTQDMIEKGRRFDTTGEQNGYAKINQAQAEEIRELVNNGMLQKDVASIYGISQQQVSGIVRHKYWNN